MLKPLVRAAALTVALALGGATVAEAATTAVATANVNLRAGPSTAYPAVIVVPAGAGIVTYGCVAGYSWCDISFGAYRGWVASSYIQIVHAGTAVVLAPAVATAAGIGVVAYNRAYWDTYYRAYPWHGRWAAYPPYGAPLVTDRNVSVNCAGGTCNGTRSATGYYGGTTAQTRSCTAGACTSTRTTTGPRGATGTRTRSVTW